ncbi:MAG: hypothetical protein HeimC2_35590, partial [Candidatus Heimdallarchaeota archaeon LC_2]
MKKINIIISLSVILLMSTSSMSVSGALPDNLVVYMDISHGELNDTAENFEGNITAAGSVFNNPTTFGLADGTNVFLLSGPLSAFTAAELTTISDWFGESGARLLWVAGNDDFDGDQPELAGNQVLEAVGSHLRVAGDAINDNVNNDGRGYRVAVNTVVKDGTLNTIFNTGVTSVMMHGPSSILGFDNGAVVDLRTETISGVEVVLKSSEFGYAIDQDFTVGTFDYYSGLGVVNDTIPMMAVEDMGDNHYVIAAGEAQWADWKNMYSTITEKGALGEDSAWNGGVHDGKTLMDNVLTWFGEEVSASEDDSDDGFL